MPELRNTDDDELLLATERYGFDPARQAEIEAALTKMANIERDEEASTFTLIRPGKRRKDPARSSAPSLWARVNCASKRTR
ncbi:MAG TPA: hypothetical protein VGS96_13375 [Thermoanaerobaculia bacterium]|jgi:hypothetical protein|nr:hypothetical protein [Thermoanaerobaculia bacterium]